jgi:hypothetical protein
MYDLPTNCNKEITKNAFFTQAVDFVHIASNLPTKGGLAL